MNEVVSSATKSASMFAESVIGMLDKSVRIRAKTPDEFMREFIKLTILENVDSIKEIN